MDIVEGDVGGDIDIKVTMPLDLICGEGCSILISAVVEEPRQLHCPDNPDLILPQVSNFTKPFTSIDC